MSDPVPQARLVEAASALVGALDQVVLGQHAASESLVAAYLAGGHALLEGVPGIGKTLLARSFAACLGVRFSRVQFTPDVMATDLTGMNVFDPSSRTFRLTRGPVFTQVLLADEINRTPPKTQSALLEAMQEGQVTIDGASHALESEFFVVATENPVEFEGTYPLPEAQLDRFLLKIEMGLPAAKAEVELYRRAVAGELGGWSRPAAPAAMVSPEEARAGRGGAALAARRAGREPARRPVAPGGGPRRRAPGRPRFRASRRRQALPRPLLGAPPDREGGVGARGPDGSADPGRGRGHGRGAALTCRPSGR
jgi:MoxR-like ATPase